MHPPSLCRPMFVRGPNPYSPLPLSRPVPQNTGKQGARCSAMRRKPKSLGWTPSTVQLSGHGPANNVSPIPQNTRCGPPDSQACFHVSRMISRRGGAQLRLQITSGLLIMTMGRSAAGGG